MLFAGHYFLWILWENWTAKFNVNDCTCKYLVMYMYVYSIWSQYPYKGSYQEKHEN